MQVDAPLAAWIQQLPHRPAAVCEAEEHHIRHHCEQHRGATEDGPVSLPVSLYTSDFRFCSQSCHLQKFSDDSAIVGCISRGQEEEYRSVVDRSVEWCRLNHLQLNVTKDKGVGCGFQKTEDPSELCCHQGVIFYAVVCWGSRLKTADTNRLNKLIRRTGSVLGVELESVAEVS
ncbi:hypothetical protein L3Q82_008247 [Scortum barcoo]|uniref:Uncharacterized protein n=1 Tax=Scortum barcoo TaxID=214431 RepID=A0ACB8WIT5_9TELE|nr:hypothetical protein L3Q82_008247 [Scortum barcoo]